MSATSYRLALFCLTLAGAGPLTSCVSETEIVGAPCPCPSGYLCCATLATCVAQAADCPERYPSSSKIPCQRDADCPQGELCPSWCLEDGVIIGPRTCARACHASFPCAADESCELTLHDGQKLETVAVRRACLPAAQQATCATSGCSSCAEEQIGQTYCAEATITGCFLALHPRCGLGCEQVVLQDCSPGQCILVDQTPTCSSIFNAELCLEHACDRCGESLLPGGARCEGDQLVRCALIFYAGAECDQLCTRLVTPCPAGETCQQEEDGPRCVPVR